MLDPSSKPTITDLVTNPQQLSRLQNAFEMKSAAYGDRL